MVSIRIPQVGQVVLGYLLLASLTLLIPFLLGRFASDSFASALDLTITSFFIYLGALVLGLISGIIGFLGSRQIATRTVFLVLGLLCGLILLILAIF